MGAEKWVESSSGYLELIDGETNTVIAREKRRKPRRTVRSGGRPPGRPSKAELALAEKNQPIRKQHLYEYDPILGDAIADAIEAGENLHTLDPEHGFPPFRELRRWVRLYPEFKEKIQEAEGIAWAIRFERANSGWDERPAVNRIERRGRPLGSKNQRPPRVTVVAPSHAPEINWDDVPLVITRFGSWEVAMEYREKITQTLENKEEPIKSID